MNEIVRKLEKWIEYKNQDIDDESESYITLNTKYENMETEQEGVKGQLKQLLSENRANREHTLKLEAQSRRDKLLLDGVAEEQNGKETWQQCKDKVYNILQQKLKIPEARKIMIIRCHRLGKFKPGQTRPRTIIFKLHWFEDMHRNHL